VVEKIFNEFSTVAIKSKDGLNHDSFDTGAADGSMGFKYVKSKEHVKKLICHIIGIYAHL